MLLFADRSNREVQKRKILGHCYRGTESPCNTPSAVLCLSVYARKLHCNDLQFKKTHACTNYKNDLYINR